MRNNFFLSALVDFPDDSIEAVYSPKSIFEMVSKLKELGIMRLYWFHYGDESYEFFWREGVGKFKNCAQTILKVKQPIRTAVEAARHYGMEIIAVIKPYENGISMVYSEGSTEAEKIGLLPHLGGKLPCMMRFVRENSEMRIKRRWDDIPVNIDSIPINTIKLYKSNNNPTRIKKDNIQIFTSNTNYGYKKVNVNFGFTEVVVAASQNFFGFDGEILAAKSDPIRTITLFGLALMDKYVIITTDFEDGEPDFINSAIDMVSVMGPDGIEIPISVGNDLNIWVTPSTKDFGCFDEGVSFDDGFGHQMVCLDTPKKIGRESFIAFTRGKNEYLPTALCEAYPEVRKLWLDMVEECLDAGVDGIDFRIENHSCHTDEPFSYGFNEIIIDEYKRRLGKNISIKEVDLKTLGEIRGDYFTLFLSEAKHKISSKGKKMHIHLNVEFLRPDPPVSRLLAYPWNICFDWKKWLDEIIIDEVTLRNFTFTPEFILNDEFSSEVIDECRKRGIPINYNRYIQPTEQYIKDLDTVYQDGRFQSFIVYEVSTLIKSDGNDGVIVKRPDFADAIRKKADELGIR